MNFKFDCRYFLGDKPCKYKTLCAECDNYKPAGIRILIIKLGAMGDVLRTTSILSGLDREYPLRHITWLVNSESYPLLSNNSKIDRLLIYNLDSALRLQVEHFDLVLSLDKAIGGAALATLVSAGEKKGFAWHKNGCLFALNKEAEYAFCLGVNDKLKFKDNVKSYQELIYEACGLKYKRDEYVLNLSEKSKEANEKFLKKINNYKKKGLIIGLNSGSGDIFATKKWSKENFIELARLLNKKLLVRLVLLGGPAEEKRNSEIKKELKNLIIDAGCNNSLEDFIGIVNSCDVIVSADTLAMQIAIALKKTVVALFGPTCNQEVDLFGRGEKIVSRVSCSPCYRQTCADLRCMKSILSREVLSVILKVADRAK